MNFTFRGLQFYGITPATNYLGSDNAIDPALTIKPGCKGVYFCGTDVDVAMGDIPIACPGIDPINILGIASRKACLEAVEFPECHGCKIDCPHPDKMERLQAYLMKILTRGAPFSFGGHA